VTIDLLLLDIPPREWYGSMMSSRQLETAIRESADGILCLLEQADTLEAICDLCVSVLRAGGKILTAGNGGSAAEALHMAEELLGRFRTNRASLPAISLAADPTVLTCIANDFGFDHVFGRQVEGLARPGDLLVLFSTSGNGRNLSLARTAAQKAGMQTVALLGRDGGALAGQADLELVVRGEHTERIQEAHQVVVHLVLDAVEAAYAGDKP